MSVLKKKIQPPFAPNAVLTLFFHIRISMILQQRRTIAHSLHLFYGDHNGGLEAGWFTLFLWDLFLGHCGHYAFHTLSCLVHVSVLKYVNTVGWKVFYSQSQHIYINNRMVGILSTVGQFFSIELHQIEWFNFSFPDKEKWNRKLRRRWGTY